MQKFKFDREKYIQIMKSEGISAALTQLHNDTIQWEFQAFEGEQGYQPKMWESLHNVRNFSRELWRLSVEHMNLQ